MPGDVTILPTTSLATAAAERKPAASLPASTRVESTPATTPSKRPVQNPSYHTDLALNMVVLQFVDDNGDVMSSVPSTKALKAYRQHSAGATAAADLSIKHGSG